MEPVDLPTVHWTYYSGVDSYSPDMAFEHPVPSPSRDVLICQLDGQEWDTAHLLLGAGDFGTGGEVVVRDGVTYANWNGLVLVDQSGSVTPDPRSKECLALRWRESPPRPNLCWEEVMGTGGRRTP